MVVVISLYEASASRKCNKKRLGGKGQRTLGEFVVSVDN